MSGYTLVERPYVNSTEYDRLDAGAQGCHATRPETLGYQVCWRAKGHDGPHLSQDSRGWRESSDSERQS